MRSQRSGVTHPGRSRTSSATRPEPPRLYERAGMELAFEFVVHEKQLSV
jgi:hypothetical protein